MSAVVVGVYEAALQRRHDRAEVWPHPEIATFITPKGASVYLQNDGTGPAIVRSIEVAVDGKPMRSWADVLAAIVGKSGSNFNVATVAGHGIRAGDRIEMPGRTRGATSTAALRSATAPISESSRGHGTREPTLGGTQICCHRSAP